jgi:hypothetical protein
MKNVSISLIKYISVFIWISEWTGVISINSINRLILILETQSCLEKQEYGRRDPSCWPCGTLYLQTLALTSRTSGGRLVVIVRSRTQATEFGFSLVQWRHNASPELLKFEVPFINTRPPLWSSGQSSWLQIRRPGFDSRHYQIFWKKKKRQQ